AARSIWGPNFGPLHTPSRRGAFGPNRRNSPCTTRFGFPRTSLDCTRASGQSPAIASDRASAAESCSPPGDAGTTITRCGGPDESAVISVLSGVSRSHRDLYRISRYGATRSAVAASVRGLQCLDDLVVTDLTEVFVPESHGAEVVRFDQADDSVRLGTQPRRGAGRAHGDGEGEGPWSHRPFGPQYCGGADAGCQSVVHHDHVATVTGCRRVAGFVQRKHPL